MIVEILKELYPIECGLDNNRIVLSEVTKNEPFSLLDKKACIDCKRKKQFRVNCNEEILLVNNNGKDIDVVDFEEYVNQNSFKATKVCDRILADSGKNRRKIVFCELFCGEEKYVEPNEGVYPQGKRARAREQMKASRELLLQKSVTGVNILTFTEKICLFAWRDNNVPDDPVFAKRGDVNSNMLAMLTTPSNMANQTTTHHELMDNGFKFMQIKYPSVYNW